MCAIETIGKSRLQPLHPDRQISLRCFDSTVIMIAEGTICIESPATALTGLEQTLLKSLLCLRRSKDRLTIIATIKNVIHCPRIFNT